MKKALFYAIVLLGYYTLSTQMLAQHVGIGTNNPQVRLDVNGGLALRSNQTFTSSANLNNNVSFAEISNAGVVATVAIGPCSSPADGQLLTIVNRNASYTATFAGMVIPIAGVAQFIYSAALPGWKAISISPSDAWLTTGNTGTNPATHFVGTIDNQSLAFRTANTERMRILDNGNVGINTSTPNTHLQVNGYTRSGMVAMGMDCSFEGVNALEENDYGCLVCVVNLADGNLYCRSTVNDQEELDDIALKNGMMDGGNARWTNWTNFGKPGGATDYIQEVQVYIQSTNSNDAGGGGWNCDGNNDWGALISVRLTNGDVWMRSTTSVSGTTNASDACVSEIGNNPGRYSGWQNLGQP